MLAISHLFPLNGTIKMRASRAAAVAAADKIVAK